MSSSRVNPALMALRREPRDSEPLTVSQLSAQLRQTVEQRFAFVSVVGELTDVKPHSSGICYMCLKDERAVLPALMWSRDFAALKFRLQNGMQVVARGKVTTYERSGKYQLQIDRLEPLGAGALQAAFEQLKTRLLSEGLFAAERKRPIPLVPRTVAVVTSPTGAVIRDIVHVATRRFPNARIIVIPSKVQGADSAIWIAAGVKRASQLSESLDLSVTIVARGGGSLEDLWGFNDERVARAIAASRIPVVSGVGHETDTTIADFVADLRAPTPSAAAEMVFPLESDLRGRFEKPVQRMRRSLRRDLSRDRQRLQSARRALGDGKHLVREPLQRIDATLARARQALTTRVRDERLTLQRAESRIVRAHPRTHLNDVRAKLTAAQLRLTGATRARVIAQRARLAELAARLHALSPLAVLDRGFALVRAEGGAVVRSAKDVVVGQQIDIRVARGQIRARVDSATPDEDA